MPYKDRDKNRQKINDYQREWAREWRKKNRELWNAYQREQARKRRAGGKEWAKIKADPIKYEQHKQYTRKFQNANKEALNAKDRERTRTLNDTYVRDQLRKEGVPLNVLYDNPIIVEAKRFLLKIKREIK